MFLNTGNNHRRFSDVSPISGIDQDGDGRGISFTDWDADGDLDVWVSNRTAPTVQVFENRWGSRVGDFIALNLQGARANRDAAGARVTILLKGEEQAPLTRSVRLGEGFQSQSSKRLHFGLGKNATISSVTVRWPGPTHATEKFSGVEINRFHLLVEGSGQARILQPRGARFVTPENAVVKPEERIKGPESSNSILLPTRQLFPKLHYRDLATGKTMIGATSGKPTLLLLWHPSCAMCFEELSMFTGKADKVRSLGIEILATTAEPAEDEDPDDAARIISKTGFPFPVGFTAGEVVERMLVLHRHLFYRPYHLSVPTSFLLDKDGRMAAIYRGAIDLEEVAEHLKALAIPDEELLSRIRPFEGSRFEPPMGLRPSVLIKTYIENQMPDEAERVFIASIENESVRDQINEIMATLGQSYFLQKKFAEAKPLFEQVVTRDPKDAKSRNTLAAIFLKDGNMAEAKRLWREASDLEEAFSAPRFNLGKQLMKEQRTTEAMILFLEYWVLEPDSPDAHNYLSMGYIRGREFAKAEIHLKRLIELSPDDGAAYTNLAGVYLALRNVAAARDIITRGLQAEGIDPRSRQALQQLSERL